MATSTGNSIDLISEYAIPAAIAANLIFGPVTDWPRQAKIAYTYLSRIWEREREERPELGNNQVTVIGGSTPEMSFPADMLENDSVARRLVEFWRIANSGDISMTVEEEDRSSTTEESDQ